MFRTLILASSSEIRSRLLRQAGIIVDVMTPRIDEEMVHSAMLSDGAKPRDIADALAEMKALKISAKHPEAFVLGCDQVLEIEGRMLSKAKTPDEAIQDIAMMRGKQHHLLSAAVICEGGKPIWRHIGQARMTMRDLSDEFIAGYVERNWDSIRSSVGSYKIEEEGVRLFSKIEGDHFTIMGMPLLDILSYLILRGATEQ